jgi:hypothetical protein
MPSDTRAPADWIEFCLPSGVLGRVYSTTRTHAVATERRRGRSVVALRWGLAQSIPAFYAVFGLYTAAALFLLLLGLGGYSRNDLASSPRWPTKRRRRQGSRSCWHGSGLTSRIALTDPVLMRVRVQPVEARTRYDGGLAGRRGTHQRGGQGTACFSWQRNARGREAGGTLRYVRLIIALVQPVGPLKVLVLPKQTALLREQLGHANAAGNASSVSPAVLTRQIVVVERAFHAAAAVSWRTLERSAVRMAVVAMRPALVSW